MPGTQTVVADNGVKLTLLASEPADTDAITVADLNAGVDIHQQLDANEDFPFDPSSKEYPADSWSTGGETPMVRSSRLNYTVGDIHLKSMVDDPDTVRAAFTANTAMYVCYRVGATDTQDDDWAADDIVHYVPINLGAITDVPKKEGHKVYKVAGSFAGNGKVGTVAA